MLILLKIVEMEMIMKIMSKPMFEFNKYLIIYSYTKYELYVTDSSGR